MAQPILAAQVLKVCRGGNDCTASTTAWNEFSFFPQPPVSQDHPTSSVVTAHPSHDSAAVNELTAALTPSKGRPRELRSKAIKPRSDLVLWDTLQQDLLGVLPPLQSNEVHLVHSQPLIDFPGDVPDVGLGGVPQPVPADREWRNRRGPAQE